MSQSENQEKSRDLRLKVFKRFLQVVVQTLIIAAILLISAGRWNWFWVWLYLAVGAGIVLVNAIILPSELIAERGQRNRDAKRWDKVIGLISVFITLGMFVIAGLDERWQWSIYLPWFIHGTGILFLVLGQALFSWGMASNRFFSTAVRIQLDREHAVETGGPYRYVRHPGYIGYMASVLATPLIFGSLWALIPAVLIAMVLVIRTALEDRTLLEELDGYIEYAERVRYRLIPGLW